MFHTAVEQSVTQEAELQKLNAQKWITNTQVRVGVETSVSDDGKPSSSDRGVGGPAFSPWEKGKASGCGSGSAVRRALRKKRPPTQAGFRTDTVRAD